VLLGSSESDETRNKYCRISTTEKDRHFQSRKAWYQELIKPRKEAIENTRIKAAEKAIGVATPK
jgi:hypothetical protein